MHFVLPLHLTLLPLAPLQKIGARFKINWSWQIPKLCTGCMTREGGWGASADCFKLAVVGAERLSHKSGSRLLALCSVGLYAPLLKFTDPILQLTRQYPNAFLVFWFTKNCTEEQSTEMDTIRKTTHCTIQPISASPHSVASLLVWGEKRDSVEKCVRKTVKRCQGGEGVAATDEGGAEPLFYCNASVSSVTRMQY